MYINDSSRRSIFGYNGVKSDVDLLGFRGVSQEVYVIHIFFSSFLILELLRGCTSRTDGGSLN
jgi:hypothetical protein